MTDALTIRPVGSAAEREACARLMSESEPWLTLQGLRIIYERNH